MCFYSARKQLLGLKMFGHIAAIAVGAVLLLRARKVAHKRKAAVLHIKGFTSGVDFESTGAIQTALEVIRELQPRAIVWDGDEYRVDSFTVLVKHICDSLPNIKEFLIFVPDKELAQGILAGWQKVLDGKDVKVMETRAKGGGELLLDVSERLGREIREFTQDDYRDHGLQALRATGARNALVLGLGSCVADEVREAPTSVSFHIVDVVRHHKVKGAEGLSRYLEDYGKRDNVRVLRPRRLEPEKLDAK